MSKGSPIITMRVSSKLLAEIREALVRALPHRRGEPWTMTGFIARAVREKLDHMARSRLNRPPKGRPERAGSRTNRKEGGK